MALTLTTVDYRRDGDVAKLTLTRPEKRNAQNPTMWRELAEVGATIAGEPGLRCLILAGEGPSFSAGLDLVEGMGGLLGKAVNSPDEDALADVGRAGIGAVNWIPQLSFPSIAAVNGHAIGAGLQLALACDFRIFADDAKVGLLETRYGILPDMGATVRLPRILGESRARELILLGELIDAQRALSIGLANSVVPAGELSAAAEQLAARLAAQPPLALRGAREAIDAAWYQDPDVSLRVALEAQKTCLESEDFAEGLQALAEGRAPQWQGR